MNEQQLIETVKQLVEIVKQLAAANEERDRTANQQSARIDAMEREITILRNVAKMTRKESGGRVYVSEVARAFSVSVWTVRRMEFEFAGLHKIKKQTASGRIYFERKEYDKWFAAQNGKQQRRKLLTRRSRNSSEA